MGAERQEDEDDEWEEEARMGGGEDVFETTYSQRRNAVTGDLTVWRHAQHRLLPSLFVPVLPDYNLSREDV